MVMATFTNQRPPSLLESAERCRASLDVLKKRARDSKAKHTRGTKKRRLLDKVDSDVTNYNGSLQAWIAAIKNGRQTSDESIIATFTKYFDTIESHTAEVSKVLLVDHRLRLLPIDFYKSRREVEDNEHISSVLKKIGDIIGDLHNNIKTVLRDSPDQKERQEKINEVVLGRPKLYHVFVKTLSRMSEEERKTTRFGEMPLLWEEIPARKDLEGHVGNADDPGDGKVYSEQDIQKAGSVLKAFYDAWHEATIKANSANAMEPETLRRVKKLTDMARICLILRGMKLERLLDHICEHDKDDRHLPFERTMLERILGPEDAPHASTFIAEQYRAICRTWNDGDHLVIPDIEPLPLEHIDKYGDGSYGTVSKTRHAFTGMYYARKEQTDGNKHLRREIAQLKRLSHRHIVQFVKSYQRSNKYGILLKPAATTDLRKLLKRYFRNGFDYTYNTDRRRDRVTLKPIILTAFGCLSRGLAHIHGCNIRHKDIKPSNILYQKAFAHEPPSFLWADFGLAYDSNKDPRYSKTSSMSRYTPRYAAPEIMEEKARKSQGNLDPDISDTDNDLSSPEPISAHFKSIGHGRKSDIYSFGIVFLEILSYLIAEGPEHLNTIPGDFEACMPVWKNITATQKWAQTQGQELSSKNPKNPLIFLFRLGSQMISQDPDARPSITEIVSCLKEASSDYFCSICQQEPEDPAPETFQGEHSIPPGHGSVHEVPEDEDQISEQPRREPPIHMNGNQPARSAMRDPTRGPGDGRRLSRARFEDLNGQAEQGSKYGEDNLEDPQYTHRKFGYKKAEFPVISRGSQHDYNVPDTEYGNNDELTSLLSIRSFADTDYREQELEQHDVQQADDLFEEIRDEWEAEQGSKYEKDDLEDPQYTHRESGHDVFESPVISLGLQYDPDGALPDAEIGNNDDINSLLSLQTLDSGYESLNDPMQQDQADELKSLLLDDHQLQKLFTIIFRRSKAKVRFVSKFRMLLRVFGNDLEREALDPLHKAAAKLAKVSATYVAGEIQRRYMMENAIDETSDGQRSARVATSLMKHLEYLHPNVNSNVTDQHEGSNDTEGALDEHTTLEQSDSEGSDDTEGALDEHTTPDQLPKISLEKLKEFMICSRAFANLQNALRRMVYPDPLNAIDDQISYAHELCPGKASAVFNVHLDIDNYINSELSYQTSLQERSDLLGSVLTISGTASGAFATTAAKYMRWKWPQLDFGLLETIECSAKAQGSKIKDSPHPNIRIERPYDHYGLKVVARGSLNELKAIAQQLAWITACFRIPQPSQTSYSEISFEIVGEMSFDIRPLQLVAIRQRENACWLPLFENGIIARGFPVPARHGQKGIELPFPVMASLANIMYPVLYEDGLYLRGVSKLLFPTAVSPDMKSVQWHLTSSPSKHIRLPHGTLPSEDVDHKWLKMNDLERLASASRTFLGYCRAVEVHLGTQASKESYELVAFSGADDEAPGPGISPKSVTTGTPGMGIFSFQVSMDIVLPKGLYSTAEPGWYIDLVDLAKEERVLVYDNAQRAQRAWLLPTLGVVLHMAHIWAVGKDLLTSLPYAAPHWDSGQASFEAIQKHSKDKLRDSLEDDKAYTVKDLIGRLLISLDKLNETEAHARSEPSRTVKLQSSKLFGWDLLAVVQGKKVVKRKQLNLSEDWMILGADNLVLFCQNFGDVIRPASGVTLCQLGNLARCGINYLTAPIQCLQTLSEERTGRKNSTFLRLADQAYWLPPDDDVFGDCTQCLQPCRGKPTRCAKIPQKLLNKEPSSRNACRSLPIEGAISFGKRKLQKSNPSIAEAYPLTPETSPTSPAVVRDTTQISHGTPTRALVVPEILIMSDAMADTSPPQYQEGRRLSPRVTPESPDTSVSNDDELSLLSRSTPLIPSSSSGVTDGSESNATNIADVKEKSFLRILGKFRKRRSKSIHNASTNSGT